MRQCVAGCEVMQAIGPALSRRAGKHIDSFIEVIDLGADGEPGWLRRALAAARHFASIATALDANYPERVHKVIIVRAPALFATVWKLVQPLVDAGTQAKISIFAGGNGPSDQPWLEEMLRHIDLSQIPAYLGGTCRCADRARGCPTRIPRGNALPRSVAEAAAAAREGEAPRTLAGGLVALGDGWALPPDGGLGLARWWRATQPPMEQMDPGRATADLGGATPLDG
jgi:hypothetical protein